MVRENGDDRILNQMVSNDSDDDDFKVMEFDGRLMIE